MNVGETLNVTTSHYFRADELGVSGSISSSLTSKAFSKSSTNSGAKIADGRGAARNATGSAVSDGNPNGGALGSCDSDSILAFRRDGTRSISIELIEVGIDVIENDSGRDDESRGSELWGAGTGADCVFPPLPKIGRTEGNRV